VARPSRRSRSELAHHCGSSGNIESAVEYLTLAAKQAAKRAAYGEALSLTRNALEKLAELPGGERRDRSDLRLQASLCNCIQLTKDYAAQELAEIYNWFSEGFDTADQKAAKALLEELSS
jgi:hypothetical protein